MARYTDPVCRICRREGLKLFLKGSRCYTKKCSFERRSTPPGMYAQRRRKTSEFGIQLREKQKVRKSYSVLERQFRNYFQKAAKRKGMTGENLLRLLEMRLDNVVFRMGLASSRAQARQLVTHGHFAVNGRPTNIPSYQTKVGDNVEVRETRRGRELFRHSTDCVGARAELRQHARVQAGRVEDRLRPLATAGIEQREGRRVGVVDHRHARRVPDHERPGRHQARGAGEEVGLVFLHP